MIHLDTNLLIALLDESHPHAAIAEHLISRKEPLGCSSLAWMELHSKQIPRSSSLLLIEILSGGIAPFTMQEAELSGELFQKTGNLRRLRFDCAIAASALKQNCKLATANTKDFQYFVPWGLQLLLH